MTPQCIRTREQDRPLGIPINWNDDGVKVLSCLRWLYRWEQEGISVGGAHSW